MDGWLFHWILLVFLCARPKTVIVMGMDMLAKNGHFISLEFSCTDVSLLCQIFCQICFWCLILRWLCCPAPFDIAVYHSLLEVNVLFIMFSFGFSHYQNYCLL